MPDRLRAYLLGAFARPFDWGAHNCCHFAGGWVRECEGADPLAALPPVNCEREALRLLHSLGGLPAAVSRYLRRPAVAPGHAVAGDVVALPLERLGGKRGRYTMGLVCADDSAALGQSVSVYLTDRGAAVYWPTADSSHAWHVGAQA